MLYDPKWNKELTVWGFVNWLKTQNPKERYSYNDPRDCAICRYMKAELGFKDPAISPALGYGEGSDGFSNRRPYDPMLDRIVCGAFVSDYGSALARAKMLLEK